MKESRVRAQQDAAEAGGHPAGASSEVLTAQCRKERTRLKCVTVFRLPPPPCGRLEHVRIWWPIFLCSSNGWEEKPSSAPASLKLSVDPTAAAKAGMAPHNV